MVSLFFNSAVDRLHSRFPLLVYGLAWTGLLTLAVALASFSPEIAFVSAISKACAAEGLRVPLDMPVCLPVHLFTKSPIDLIVPPIFAALVVAASAFVVRAVGLWENDALDLEGL
uniref:Uncharacterized protein n=1 Tax=Kalanchoe fedtschenkoi TaxID=63787 RepID=A0A7N0ZYT3_KALFE